MNQIERVLAVVRDGRWRTLRQIANAAKAPEASVSARLRDIRRILGFAVVLKGKGQHIKYKVMC